METGGRAGRGYAGGDQFPKDGIDIAAVRDSTRGQKTEVGTLSSFLAWQRTLESRERKVFSQQGEDGVLEAFHDPDKPFVVGLQFHPERAADEYPGHTAIFERFVKTAQQIARGRALA